MKEENKIKAYATCPDELTGLLANELEEYGAEEIRTAYSVVYFTADEALYYRLHFTLSLASRICKILKEIPAQRPEIIFDKTRRIRFDKLFASGEPLNIHIASSNRGQKIENHLIGSKVREAVNDCFMHHTKVMPNQSAFGAAIGLNGFMNNQRLMVSLDTSGESLHRRGYRLEGHAAPLKESLASALLRVIGYDGSQNFYDPMCGSGTIAIEAARIAAGIAPLSQRKKEVFALTRLKGFNSKLFDGIRQELKDGRKDPAAEIYASDILEKYVNLSAQSAELAGVSDIINFAERDFFQTEKPAENGILIANIPYGMRLDEKTIDDDYFKKLGDYLKNNYQGWRVGLLVPAALNWKHIGLRTAIKRQFTNARIPVKFLVFEMY